LKLHTLPHAQILSFRYAIFNELSVCYLTNTGAMPSHQAVFIILDTNSFEVIEEVVLIASQGAIF